MLAVAAAALAGGPVPADRRQPAALVITDLIGIELPIDPSWPLGLISAVLAAALLWPVGARLGLSPASRATAAAIYATAAVLVEVVRPGRRRRAGHPAAGRRGLAGRRRVGGATRWPRC